MSVPMRRATLNMRYCKRIFCLNLPALRLSLQYGLCFFAILRICFVSCAAHAAGMYVRTPPRAFGLASSHLHQTDKKAVFAALFRHSGFNTGSGSGYCARNTPSRGASAVLGRPIACGDTVFGRPIACGDTGFGRPIACGDTGSGSGYCALRNTPSRGASAVFLMHRYENR